MYRWHPLGPLFKRTRKLIKMFFALDTQALGDTINAIRQEYTDRETPPGVLRIPEPLRNFYDTVIRTKKAWPTTIITIHPAELIQVATWIMLHPTHSKNEFLASFAKQLTAFTRGKENVKS